jgi:hypothetical protein
LHAAGCEPPSAYGEQTKATFILAEHPHRTGVRERDGVLQPFSTGRLELADGLRVFLCDWAAAP